MRSCFQPEKIGEYYAPRNMKKTPPKSSISGRTPAIWLMISLLWLSSPATGTEATHRHGLAADIHLFSGQEMQDAYGTAWGIDYQYREDLAGNLCYAVSAGLLAASGTPAVNPATSLAVWSSSLYLFSLPLDFSLERTLPFSLGSGTRFYAGLGAGGQVGFEVLRAELAGVLFVNHWQETSFRTSWTGHLVLGTEFSQSKYRPFLEIRWVQGGRGSDSDGLSGEERAKAADELYDAVSRPDGRFSGWQFRLGVSF